MNNEELISELKKINIEINDNQWRQLSLFCDLLVTENKKYNLTAITNLSDVYLKHIYDSLTLVKIVDLINHQMILDIGSGAGFPGIILKIVFPHLHITLLDSNGKKTKFLHLVKEKLELENIEIINDRAENYIVSNRERFDIVTARAVADLSVLLEIGIPFVKVGGYFIAMKGKSPEEILAAKEVCSILNSNVDSILEFTLPIENSARTLIRIEKNSKTPNLYPRSYDKILKKPLKIIEK